MMKFDPYASDGVWNPVLRSLFKIRFMISTLVRAVQVYASGVINLETARSPFGPITSPTKITEALFLLSSFGPCMNILINDLKMPLATQLYSSGPTTRMALKRLMIVLGNAK